jgi:hypothetical protein
MWVTDNTESHIRLIISASTINTFKTFATVVVSEGATTASRSPYELDMRILKISDCAAATNTASRQLR